MSGFKEEWEDVRHGAERKTRTESRRNRWNGGNGIRYDGGRHSAPAGRLGIHGNPKLQGAVFNVLGNTSKMAVCVKKNVERCSKYTESKFKGNPAGAVAAIQTKTKPSNPEPKKPEKDASKVNIII